MDHSDTHTRTWHTSLTTPNLAYTTHHAMISLAVPPQAVSGFDLKSYPRAFGAAALLGDRVVCCGGVNNETALLPSSCTRLELPALSFQPVDYLGLTDGVNRVCGALHAITLPKSATPVLVLLGNSVEESPMFAVPLEQPRVAERERKLSTHVLTFDNKKHGEWKTVETNWLRGTSSSALAESPNDGPSARIGFASAQSQSRVFYFGGKGHDGLLADVGYISWASSTFATSASWKSFEPDKPHSGTWPEPRAHASALCQASGNICLIIAGGVDSKNRLLGDVHVCKFDSQQNRVNWSEVKLAGSSPALVPRRGATLVPLVPAGSTERFLIFGGAEGTPSNTLQPQVLTLPLNGGTYRIASFDVRCAGGVAAKYPLLLGAHVIEVPPSMFSPGTTIHKLCEDAGITMSAPAVSVGGSAKKRRKRDEPLPPVSVSSGCQGFLVFGGASWPASSSSSSSGGADKRSAAAAAWPIVSGDLHFLLWDGAAVDGEGVVTLSTAAAAATKVSLLCV